MCLCLALAIEITIDTFQITDILKREVMYPVALNSTSCCCCSPRPGPSSSQSRFPLSR